MDNWAASICGSSYFLKNYYHIFALAVNKKLTEIPLEYKNVLIKAKPKRGRKPKALLALKKQ